MLKNLHIKNIALIDELNIEFNGGLNVLSGETGAGKSIIVDSLNLVLGERADRDLIKSGQERASVEAEFDISSHNRVKRVLNKNEIEDMGGVLVLARELWRNDRNVCRINGTLVTLTVVKKISDLLVDIHGQHEHQTLLHNKNHLGFIDRFGAERIRPLRITVTSLYEDYASIERSIELLCGDERERERNMDLLRFQIDEITHSQLKPDEDEILIAEKKRLHASEKVIETLTTGYQTLFEGSDGDFAVLDRLKDLSNSLSAISDIDPVYETLMERLNEAYYIAEEAGMEIREQKENYYHDPDALAETEARIDEINTLKRKYGATIDDIFAFLARSEKEYDRLVNAEEQLSILTEKIKEVSTKLYTASRALSEERRETAKRFEVMLLNELSDLGMTGAGFNVQFSLIPDEADAVYTAGGFDKVAFYITLNPGEPLKPLSKVASGGEISRIMLSFKNILGQLDVIETNVFDEIDTGISGRIANVVAEKLSSIAGQRQVICVTHLAQIAAHADRHFLIKKTVEGAHTKTATYPLDMDGRVKEVARLAGGNDSELSLSHAREMIINAGKAN
jgi:DNA repair protein RecN (Recombination protein N)